MAGARLSDVAAPVAAQIDPDPALAERYQRFFERWQMQFRQRVVVRDLEFVTDGLKRLEPGERHQRLVVADQQRLFPAFDRSKSWYDARFCRECRQQALRKGMDSLDPKAATGGIENPCK